MKTVTLMGNIKVQLYSCNKKHEKFADSKWQKSKLEFSLLQKAAEQDS